MQRAEFCMTRPGFTAAVLMCAGVLLGGCGLLNTVLSSTIADLLPHWAGGLPPGTPPRRSDPGYAEFIRSQNAKALVASGQSADPDAVAADIPQRAGPEALSPRPISRAGWHGIY
jgi:hypothetical protein